jgi:hypothetical protein
MSGPTDDPDRPAPLSYATPAESENPTLDRQAGIFTAAAVCFLIAGLVIGMVPTPGHPIGPAMRFLRWTGIVVMLAAGATAMAAWACAVLAFRRPGPRRNATWAIVVSTLILAVYALFFLMLLANT